MVNYTERDIPYTRIIEHKHFEFGNQPHTIITYEFPDEYADGKEPYYPINDEVNGKKYAEYKKLAQQEENVIFGGRLATYVYADMDDTIAAALKLVNEQLKRH